MTSVTGHSATATAASSNHQAALTARRSSHKDTVSLTQEVTVMTRAPRG